ncbi:uncharacterized protein BDZ99DRAFT_444024 [Mytilinidion resinicola]|uniref:MutL C-terminal dimerisation domain-containing protein n=1 Tax=Mytilinidion resinicola TaxID=574789 RepID=A0A6A6YNM8_9PEZI|nr:uncharacterized protein BDZ99DRAFT_444024 [Mytilinidion resinicola]KAF2809614.1 hypothetical protein BDZ99DRAFT_444024 [Mytilinidion resinicola]
MHQHGPPQSTTHRMPELRTSNGCSMDTSKDAMRNRSQGAILPLPADVIAQIKSSTAITSLTGVVVELFKNALDAGATKLEATVDFGRGGCTVEDNGLGIAPEEFRDGGGLGRMYYTSRYNSGDATFGRNGSLFASLAAMSLLTITSHHHEHRSHNTMTLHHCKPIARQIPAPSHHDITWRDHGTRVTVRDLFGNMPVRVKQRVQVLEERSEHDRLWEALKRDVTGLLLGWQGECSIRIRDADTIRNFTLNGPSLASLGSLTKQKPTGEKRIAPELQYMLNMLTQASYIPREDWKLWVPASASTSQVSIKGAISLEPAPSKRVQFLSLGIRSLSAESGHNELYDEINRLFSLSSFGAVEDASDVDDHEKERRKHDKRFKSDGITNRQLRGARKGTDKWPMFSLRVCLKEPSTASMPESLLLESESKLRSIIEVLRAMLTQWLSVHHFRPRKQRTAFDKPLSESLSPPDEKTPPRAIHSFFDGSKTETDVVRVATPDVTNKKRKRSTPSTIGSVTKSKSEAGTQRQYQPFTEWSRIKSGKSGFYDTLWNTGKVVRKNESQDQENQVSIMPFSPFSVEPILQGSLGDLSLSIDLSSVDSTAVMEDQSPTNPNPHENEPEHESSHLDETITWTNPSTKQTFLINARTGCVVPKESQRPQTESSLFSTPTILADYNRPLRLRQRKRPATTDESSNPWLNGLLNEWDNPVFKQAELSIPQVSLNGTIVEAIEDSHFKHDCGHVDMNKAFKEASLSRSSKLSKAALQYATVIAQVDKKFILVKTKGDSDDNNGTVLVLIDQHAADERIRVEALLSDLCMPIPESANRVPFRSNLGHKSRVDFTVLSSPLRFSLSSHESQIFRTHAPTFAAWGILYNLTFPTQSSAKPPAEMLPSTLTIITLPPAIAERCQSDPKLLINLLRSEVYKLDEAPARLPPKPTDTEPTKTHHWLRSIGSCPLGLLDLVNSRACRSAIMFNDELSVDECRELVRKLSTCAFPFQCAHGRPSMVPLVEIGTGDESAGFGAGAFGDALGGMRGDTGSKEKSFVDAFRAWKEKERGGGGS